MLSLPSRRHPIACAAFCLAAALAAAAGVSSAQAQRPAPLPQASAAATPEKRSTLDDQQSVAVTIYNDDLALVKDVRKVELDSGANQLALRDVSAHMRPETAQLRSLSHPGSFSLLEQNFDFDLLTPGKLLEKYVGRTVRVVKTHPTTGLETTESAQVLSAQEGLVLKIGDRIETGAPGRIVFDGVPANLRDRPTLVTQLQNKQPGTQEVELSYLTGGLSWRADYVAELNADDSGLDMNGWVTVNNLSGTAFANARLQLVAGDVNRVREDLALKNMSARGMVAAAAPVVVEMKQESLFEYHLYSLPRPTTLAQNQTKQVALLNAAGVPVAKEILLRGQDHYYHGASGVLGQKIKAAVYVEFANRESANLGQPLPKGVVRVYKRDSAGNAQFIGEDHIDHTPRNEKVRLHLGDAFDVTADKKQTDFRRRDLPDNRYAHESAYEIVVRNAKSEAVTVTVQEPVPGDWAMLEESQKHSKVSSGMAQWRLSVPAEGAVTLKYRVRVRY
jgi:hypothetical protein